MEAQADDLALCILDLLLVLHSRAHAALLRCLSSGGDLIRIAQKQLMEDGGC